ncbi:hypothetical protein Moror_7696 [Moniliophthora roreri MCA 2997]|uniref:GDP/GTP exchange factor Sec2 N-terminal domain-containing protein n=1 Tax=Moniliophthora roreri (strain MCA 2997) TaxID=1381753 RepID=V2X925_MONRO|nr:hypothetical protein Moror_7696 [Moniliophthora roreri MCA 2997]
MAQDHTEGHEASTVNNHDDKASIKSSKSRHLNGTSDSDAQAMVIASLRSQVQDLYSQVTQLNSKLVKSYDRVSDLEDDLHMASAKDRQQSLRISQLEMERTQHLSALNTGLLVEKAQVTAELTRLMEKATEEAAQRGQAESARAAIEKDLDDLSASLFDQANTMVAEARYARSLSEQKVASAEQALKGAEEAVAMMQQQMQELQAEKDASEERMQEMQALMGKGKWVERQGTGELARSTRLLSTHAPYQEFLLFIAHLRSVHPSSPQPPAMTTLLPLPFLTRLMTEDSEPTLRLDLAPSLNWLSRRSVLAAIHGGQLTIEPISSSALLQETHLPASNIPGLGSSATNICCALCGVPVFPSLNPVGNPQSRPPMSMALSNSNTSWSTSLFKRQSNGPGNSSPPPSPPPRLISRPHAGSRADELPPQVHIFRITALPTTNTLTSVSIPSLPMTNSSSVPSSSALPQPPQHPTAHHTSSLSQSSSSATIYPLCTSDWCLSRLRATCSMWAFVRSGIVERVWEEEVQNVAPPSTTSSPAAPNAKPPTTPKRRGLWGMATALGERAASWSESDKDKFKKEKEKEKELPKAPQAPTTPEKKLVVHAPPPMHPSKSHAQPGPVVSSHIVAPTSTSTPPPLPKRNEGRSRPINPPPKPVEGISTTEVVLDASPTRATTSDPAPTTAPAQVADSNPANIPLPESRPATPSMPVVAVGSSPVSTPPRTASPAPTGAVPPPLPRRALARGPRPMGPAKSRISTTPTTAEDAEKKALIGVEEGKQTTIDLSQPEQATPVSESEPEEKTELSLEEAKPEQAPEPEQATAVPEGEHTKDVASVEVTTPEKTDPVESSMQIQTVESPAKEAADNVVAEAARVESPPPNTLPSSSGDDQIESKETTDADPMAKQNDEQQEATGDERAGAEEGTEKVKAADGNEGAGKGTDDSEKDNERYLGDATWEERTWKEVVRLKEVMFWARIGGLRE